MSCCCTGRTSLVPRSEREPDMSSLSAHAPRALGGWSWACDSTVRFWMQLGRSYMANAPFSGRKDMTCKFSTGSGRNSTPILPAGPVTTCPILPAGPVTTCPILQRGRSRGGKGCKCTPTFFPGGALHPHFSWRKIYLFTGI